MLLLHSDLHFGWFLIVARRGDGCHLKESWLSSLFSSLLSNSIGSDFVWKGAFFSGVHGRSSLLIMVTQGLRLMETRPWHVLLTSLSQHLRVWRLEASLTLHTATVGHREFCAGLERWLSHSAHNQKHKRVIGNPTLKETEKGNSALCSLRGESRCLWAALIPCSPFSSLLTHYEDRTDWEGTTSPVSFKMFACVIFFKVINLAEQINN